MEGRNRRIDHIYFIEEGFASVVATTGLASRASRLALVAKSNTPHRTMLHYAHAYLLQTTATALANGRSKIEER
jgi:hypothetical protein